MTSVAVMQPYFVPYAGYFRLFAAADIFVYFDCVQFPRRGWVHRNRFSLLDGDLDWLTLPIRRADFDARIEQMRFAEGASSKLESDMHRFPSLKRALRDHKTLMEPILDLGQQDLTEYLCNTLAFMRTQLGLEVRTLRSSSLEILPSLRGQERVLSIVKAVGGTRYINPPGGRELYDAAAFKQSGIELQFLTPYEGDMRSILERLLQASPVTVAAEIRSQSRLIA